MSNPDDLDDGLLYDNVLSETEAEGVTMEQEEMPKERKRSIGEAEAEDKDVGEDKTTSKRQKKLLKSKKHEKKREMTEYLIEQRKSIPKSSTETITEYLATLIRDKNPNLSALELEELYFKKTDFISTQKYVEKERNLTNFPDFVTQFSKAPKAIVFSMSNIRVADVSRSLHGGNNCVKLFSKNKLKEDLDIVEKTLGNDKKKEKKFQNIKYFIATPTRMQKILESTDLFYQGKDKLDIILDASYMDPKKNTLLACENTIVLCQVLKNILKEKSSVKILLY